MRLQDLFEMASEAFGKVRSIFRSNFSRRRIELVLPAHAFERAVDGERGKDVTEEHLIQALQQFLKKYDEGSREIQRVFQRAREEHSAEVTFKYPIDETFVNFPTVIKFVGGGKYKFTIKTIMVKKDFKTYANDIVITL